MMKCTRCGHEKAFKNGQISGKQRYKCPRCGYQFTPEAARGVDDTVKLIACLMHVNGMSYRAIANLLNVSATSVSNWVSAYPIKHISNLPSRYDVSVVEGEDLCNCLPIDESPESGKLVLVVSTNIETDKGVVIAERLNSKKDNIATFPVKVSL